MPRTCSSCRCRRRRRGLQRQSDELSRAQVCAATIREVVRHQPPPPDDPDALPVVYVVAVGETTIAADVQAEVATELHDEVDVQFADERDEAVDEDVEDAPVLDDGVLIAVGELALTPDPVSMEVEVYRSERDVSKAVFSFAADSSNWSSPRRRCCLSPDARPLDREARALLTPRPPLESVDELTDASERPFDVTGVDRPCRRARWIAARPCG